MRKATRAEAPQQAIYDALGVGSAPGGIRKSALSDRFLGFDTGLVRLEGSLH